MAKIKLRDGRTAEVRDDWAQDYGITDFHSLQKAAKKATGGINVFIDGKEYLFHDNKFKGNQGLRSGEQQDLGTGFLQDAAGFVQDHNKVVGPGSDNFNMFAGAVGAGLGANALLGGLGGVGAGATEAVGTGLGGAGGSVAGLPSMTMEGALGGGLGTASGGSGLGLAAPTLGASGAGLGTAAEYSLGSGLLSGAGAGSGLTAGGALGGAAGGASLLGGLKNFLPSGTDTSKLLGAALPAGLGYLGASGQSDAMKDIYNQTRADRMPALNAYNTALQNPNTFYQSAPAMGAVDAVLRKLSVGGNPAANPGSLSQAAAYNLGGYNDYLRGLTPAAFGTANTEANVGMNQAGADAGKYNALGYGLGQYLNPQPNLNDLLKNLSLNVGGVRL